MEKRDIIYLIPAMFLLIAAFLLRNWTWVWVIYGLIGWSWTAIITDSRAATHELEELLNALEKWDVDAVRSQSKFLAIRHRARRALKFLKGETLDENDE